MKDYLLCFKQQKSRGAGSPRGVLRDVPLVLMTCVVHYGVTRCWRRRGGLWEGLSPSATEGGPPLWDCQRWGLLEESSCPKNTHTHIRSQVPSQDTKQMVTSYICFTQPRRNRTKCRTGLGSDRLATFYEFPDRCSEFNTDPQLCTPRGSSVFPLGCYIKTRYVIYKEIFVNGG